jgi:hypothetical protein
MSLPPELSEKNGLEGKKRGGKDTKPLLIPQAFTRSA